MSQQSGRHRKKQILAALFTVGMAFFLAEYGHQLSLSALWTSLTGEAAEETRVVPATGGAVLPGEVPQSGTSTDSMDSADSAENVPAVPPYTTAESIGREPASGEAVYPLLPAMDALADARIVQRIHRMQYRTLKEAGLLDPEPDGSQAASDETESGGTESGGTESGGTESGGDAGTAQNPDGTASNSTAGAGAGTAKDAGPVWGTYNPLTGLPMDADTVRVRPKAVILNNLKKAQPQFGNSQADILYEVPAEGGITRMVAVYQKIGSVGTIGSVRSARRYLVELAMGHDALLIHAGGSPEAYQDIKDWNIDNMDGVRGTSDASIFWRDANRRKTMGYEHSLMTSGNKILTYLNKGRYRTEHPEGWRSGQLFAARNALKDGEWARHVEIRFSDYKTGVFDYDEASGEYLASQYGKAYVDGGSGEQVHADNVLILKTDIAEIPGDKEKRLTVRTTGEGRGWFFHSGRYVSIRWSRADRNSEFVYTRLNGTPLTLGQGMTYVCIVNADAVPVVSASPAS